METLTWMLLECWDWGARLDKSRDPNFPTAVFQERETQIDVRVSFLRDFHEPLPHPTRGALVRLFQLSRLLHTGSLQNFLRHYDIEWLAWNHWIIPKVYSSTEEVRSVSTP